MASTSDIVAGTSDDSSGPVTKVTLKGQLNIFVSDIFVKILRSQNIKINRTS